LIETIEFPTDFRGLVLEPLRPEEFAAQRNAHLVLTVPGCIRGNHYHRLGTEVTTVLGPALVRVLEGDAIRDYEVADGRAMRFTFPPGVAHAIQNTGTTPQIAISFNTEPHDPARPDVVREILIDPNSSKNERNTPLPG
jgi:UDP-2-acetamido-2,6-beta-L-arabino-hexul-4-ose reductase